MISVPKFDLVRESWIPVQGSRDERRTVGLAEVLKSAHELQGIDDPSPLVEASLYRLLLALVLRIFPAGSRREWSRLCEGSALDPDKIDAYFERWQHRFDLLDRERPFFQNPRGPEFCSSPWPLSGLAHELASGNNTTLFDHTTENGSSACSSAKAARLIVATQAWAVGGGQSKPFYFSHGPLLGIYVLLVRGSTLRDTLLLNTGKYPLEGVDAEDDAPVWERDELPEPADKQGEPPAGRLDLFTWQSRKLLLVLSADDADQVTGVHVSQHRKLRHGYPDEPMAAYRKDPKKGWRPLNIQLDRDVWRDSHAFFAVTDADRHPPLAMSWLAELVEDGILDDDARFPVQVYGLRNEQAKLLMWRSATLPLGLRYLHDPDCCRDLEIAIRIADGGGRHLRVAVRTYASEMLVRPGGGKPDRDAVDHVAKQLSVPPLFWATLAPLADDLLATLTGPADHRTGRLEAWHEDVTRAARESFARVVGQHGSSARHLRAAARAERHLGSKLRSLWEKATQPA